MEQKELLNNQDQETMENNKIIVTILDFVTGRVIMEKVNCAMDDVEGFLSGDEDVLIRYGLTENDSLCEKYGLKFDDIQWMATYQKDFSFEDNR